MQRNRRLFVVVLAAVILALVVAACAPAETPTPTEEPATAEAVEEATPTEEPTEEPTEVPTEEETEEPTEEPTEEAVEEATEEATEEAMVEAEPGTIVEVASASDDFSTLVAAVEAAGLVDALNGETEYTVFAPTNAAFEAALESLGLTAEELLADTDTLTSILTYHVVEGVVPAATVLTLDGEEVTTLNGATVTISIEDDAVVLNGSVNVTATDVMASNGIIHVIDGVLLPPAAEEPMEEATEEAAMEEPMEEATEEAMAEATEAPAEEVIVEVTEAPEEVDAAADGIQTLCLVTDLGRVNDGTFNEFAHAGAVSVSEAYDLEYRFIETQSETDYEANINTCIEEGFEAVITVGFLIADATREAAENNPGVFFIGVDQFVADGPSNLVGIQFREDQAGFLAGALAALVADTVDSNTIAGVYGVDIPPVKKFRNGFEQGARYIDPDMELLGVYIDDFIAPDRGASAAEQFLGEGASVIFGAGGLTGSGGITAAAQQGVYVIGVDQDEYFTTFGNGETPGAEFLISSAIKRVDQGVFDMVAALAENNMDAFPGGGVYLMDASLNGVGLAPKHDADVSDDIYAQTEDIFAMLASGELQTGVDPVTGDLVEPMEEPMEEATEEAAMEEPMGTIVDVAVANEDFSTLVAAVQAAGLVDALSGDTELTVFAPTNAAFAATLESLGMTAEELLADTDLLNTVLTYHVIEGAVPASTVITLDGQEVSTINGASISISLVGGTVVLNDTVNVTATDIMANNGIIHVIDGVLLPPAASE